MHGRALRLIVVMAAALWAALPALAGTVTLRSSARVAADAPVTLADVATLEGDAAAALADAVLMERPGAQALKQGFAEVTLQQVREAIEARGANWGRIALRGSVCVVRFTGATREAEAPEAAPERTHEAVSSAGEGTVRSRVGALLASVFGVEAQDLRVLFDERDAAFLDMREWGRRVELQPNSTGTSSRQSVTVRVYEGDMMVDSRTIRADALVRRRVVTLRDAVRRGDTIAEANVAEQTLWLDPGGPAPVASSADAVGMHVVTRVGAGEVLRGVHVAQPVVIGRGERVTVHCISGGIALQVKARALGDARLGELVELRIEGRQSGFTARASGRAVAVVNLDAPQAGVQEEQR